MDVNKRVAVLVENASTIKQLKLNHWVNRREYTLSSTHWKCRYH